MKVRLCELCKEEAAVFCPADAAFLCRGCDARVHGANFLVARHVRQSLHATCHDPVTSDDSVVDTLSSSSSACNSSTTKKGTTTTTSSCNYSTSVNDKKSQRALVNSSNLKGVFIDWCRSFGLGGGQDLSEVVRTACAALKVCTAQHLTFLPLRVGLAAALWLGLRLGGRRRSSLLQTWKVAKRLEEVSGVPERVILAVGSKLERVARINSRQKRRDLEEGWDESS